MNLQQAISPRNRQLPPDKLDRLQRLADTLQGELERRARNDTSNDPDVSWARSFAGRPREFIGQLAGIDWWSDDWTAWRAFVAALFGQELSPAELAVYRECTGRDDPPTALCREAWAPVGRRGGKSRVLALIACYLATVTDWAPYLAPGERGYIVVLAAQRKQAQAIMGYVKATLLGSKHLRPLIEQGGMLSESVALRGNIVIEVVTASISAVRSRTVVAALADEIAFWRSDESSANPDAEILNGLRPAMATIPNSMLLAASSPYARRGVLWESFQRYYGRDDGPLVWRAATRVMHPSVPQSFLDEEYAKDPIAAAAEYGAEFRADIAAFVTREVVDAAVVPGRRELPPRQGIRYQAFVDPAGGSGGDSMTLAIGHREGTIAVLDCVRETRPPFSPEAVAAEYSGVLKSYHVSTVRGDHYAGEWPREQFRKNGVRYETSDETKSEIYVEFLPLLNSNRVRYLDLPRLVDQTATLERRTSRGGRDSIDHPPGGHDDVVNVAAGVLVQVAVRSVGPMKISSEVLARAAAQG